MAIHNPSSLYTAGAVTFDSRPATMYYLQEKAHKRAKEEAIDNYFRDLGKNLTPAGMSPDDVPEFINKSNAYKQFAIQNKDALRNPALDGGKAMNQANYLYNDALEHSAMSVGKVKNLSLIPNLTPEQRDRLVTHSFESMHNATLPVTDKNYRPFSQIDIEYNPADYTTKDETEFISNATKNRVPNEETTFGETNPKTFMHTKTTKKVYTPEALQGIAADAASEYASNKSAKQQFDKLFEKSFNPQTGQVEIPSEYNDAFKSVFGKDIHHPQELAAGYYLNKIQKESTKAEDVEDKIAYGLHMESVRQANRERMLNKKKEAMAQLKKGDSGWVNTYFDGVIAGADANKDKETLYKGTPIITDPLISKALTRGGQEPDVISYQNGTLSPIYYRRRMEDAADGKSYHKGDIVRGTDNNPEIIVQYSNPISVQQAKALLLNVAANTKLDAAEMSSLFGEDAPEDNSSIPDFLRPE